MPTDPNSKASFVLYHSHWKAIKILPDEKLGRLFRSIYERELNGVPIDLSDDPQLNMAYSFMSIQLDFDRSKWESIRTKRSDAGKDSARARRAKKEEEQKKHLFDSTNIDEQNEHLFDSTNIDEQNEHLFDSTNIDEQNEHLFDSTNIDEQNEHMIDLSSKTNKDEHNVNVDVDGDGDGDVEGNGDDDGDDGFGKADATNTNTNTSSSYCFWDFYPVMFFAGFKNPVLVTKEYVRYYEDQDWTLRGGRKLLTLDDKVKKARKWVPKDSSLKSPRTDMDFLAIWEIIWKTMTEDNVPEHIIKLALDEQIKVEYNDSAKTMTIYLPKDVVEYIEPRAKYLELLKRFRVEKGMTRIEYMFLRKSSMAKYTL